MSGVHISYSGRATTFWYPCTKKQAVQTVRDHVANWSREEVDGVTREIPKSDVIAVFCTGILEKDGNAELLNPEPIQF